MYLKILCGKTEEKGRNEWGKGQREGEWRKGRKRRGKAGRTERGRKGGEMTKVIYSYDTMQNRV